MIYTETMCRLLALTANYCSCFEIQHLDMNWITLPIGSSLFRMICVAVVAKPIVGLPKEGRRLPNLISG